MPPSHTRVVHHIRGRTRLHVPAKHIDALAEQLGQSEHVQAVRRSHHSLVVNHDHHLADLIGEIEATGICTLLHLPDAAEPALAALGPAVLSAVLLVLVVVLVS